jgi:hypothetical protein
LDLSKFICHLSYFFDHPDFDKEVLKPVQKDNMSFLNYHFSFENLRAPADLAPQDESLGSSNPNRQSGYTDASWATTNTEINTPSIPFPSPTRKCRLRRVIDSLQKAFHIKTKSRSPSQFSVILPKVSPRGKASVPHQTIHIPEDAQHLKNALFLQQNIQNIHLSRETRSLASSSSTIVPPLKFPVLVEYVEQTNQRISLLPRAAVVHVVSGDGLDHFKERAKGKGIRGAFEAVDVDKMEVVGLDVIWNQESDPLGGLGEIVSTLSDDEEFLLAIDLMKARGWRDRFQLRYNSLRRIAGEAELGTTWTLVG